MPDFKVAWGWLIGLKKGVAIRHHVDLLIHINYLTVHKKLDSYGLKEVQCAKFQLDKYKSDIKSIIGPFIAPYCFWTSPLYC